MCLLVKGPIGGLSIDATDDLSKQDKCHKRLSKISTLAGLLIGGGLLATIGVEALCHGHSEAVMNVLKGLVAATACCSIVVSGAGLMYMQRSRGGDV